MLLQTRSCSNQEPLQITDQQRRVWACDRPTPAWCLRLWSPMDSGRDYSVATSLGQWSAVSRGPQKWRQLNGVGSWQMDSYTQLWLIYHLHLKTFESDFLQLQNWL